MLVFSVFLLNIIAEIKSVRVFVNSEENSPLPTEYARGPFGGLQGGAVAALLCSELEGVVSAQRLGKPVSVSATFLRPTPFGPVGTEPVVLKAGGRSSTLMNTLSVDRKTCAVLVLSALQENAVTGMAPIPPYAGCSPDQLEPKGAGTLRPDGPWLMDIFDVRVDLDFDTVWFGVGQETLDGMSPLAFTLLVADWAHGINRPMQSGYADPNVNLFVHALREPEGRWIGVQSRTVWVDGGIGCGNGTLLDESGTFGWVSMGVAVSKFGEAG